MADLVDEVRDYKDEARSRVQENCEVHGQTERQQIDGPARQRFEHQKTGDQGGEFRTPFFRKAEPSDNRIDSGHSRATS